MFQPKRGSNRWQCSGVLRENRGFLREVALLSSGCLRESFGISRSGFGVSSVNPEYTPKETRRQLVLCDTGVRSGTENKQRDIGIISKILLAVGKFLHQFEKHFGSQNADLLF